MVCDSGLVKGPSICGAAVCVQLIGVSTMAGCRGQKQILYKMAELCRAENQMYS